MIILKLADGSYTKITNDDYAKLINENFVYLRAGKRKMKKSYEDKIVSFVSKYRDGITIGKVVNRFRSLDKDKIIDIINELEKNNKIQSIYSIKIQDSREVRTLFISNS